MSKGSVTFCLVVSVALHVAVLGGPSVFSPVGEKPRRVEVGLVTLPPQASGKKSAGAENDEVEAAPSPEKRELGRSVENATHRHNAPSAHHQDRAPVLPSRTLVPLVSSGPEVRLDSMVEATTPSRQALSEPLQETMPAATAGGPSKPMFPAGAYAQENPTRSETSGTGRASVDLPLIEALPRYDSNPPPVYPRLARERGWEGEVLLRVVVTEGGRVRQVTVERSSGHALLDRTALQAVRRWRFHPCRLGATPVEGEVRIPVRFELRES